jgi:protein-S-isoprenylcysteine O-methyltransferase Ste14
LDPWFLLCAAGLAASLSLHWLSVEHGRLRGRFGEENGRRIGDFLGYASGWGFFGFLAGMWFSPQPSFAGPDWAWQAGVLLLAVGAAVGLAGVKEVSLRVSETHRPSRVVSSGVYSFVRHPQYLAALLAHAGASLLLSASYSLVASPLVFTVVYAMCWKEEMELVREFGAVYEEYRRRVPMLVPGPGDMSRWIR